MAAARILAIDQGTTSSRALVVDELGAVLGIGQVAFRQYYPEPGRVEHDADEIWTSTQEAIATALAAASVTTSRLTAIGITNQRETLVAWDRATGAPVAPAIVWQDRRTAPLCEDLRLAGHEETIAHHSGLTIDPYFTGTKLAWLLESQPSLRSMADSGGLAVGTVDSWLLWKLTGGAVHATDFTNASRTMLFNIRRGRWDETLCEILNVPSGILPRAAASMTNFGYTDSDVLGARIPITGIAGDQQSALFGQACTRPGLAKNTYGTGAFVLAPAGREPRVSENRLLVSLGANTGKTGPEYVVEGSVFVAGAAVQWLRDGLGIISTATESEALAGSVADSGGVTFVPAFTGLGAPYWDPGARGAMFGLNRGTTSGHLARATLEAIAMSSADLIAAINRDLPQPVTELRVDGGASANNLLMQMQADLAGIPVVRPTNIETTALGAAYLAGITAGVWESEEAVDGLWQPDRSFEPRIGDDEREEQMEVWHAAIRQVSGGRPGG
ncbi:MAG: glycerol kinase GlpK [Dehalococcoidia bacterium]